MLQLLPNTPSSAPGARNFFIRLPSTPSAPKSQEHKHFLLMITPEAPETKNHVPSHHLTPCNPPATARYLEWTQTTPTPFMLQEKKRKMQKCHWHCGNALRRFLVTLAMRWHIIASDFDGPSPHGSPLDSLGSFKVPVAWQVVDNRCCTHFLHAQHQQLFYMYCHPVIYIIYFSVYNMCVGHGGLVVQ